MRPEGEKEEMSLPELGHREEEKWPASAGVPSSPQGKKKKSLPWTTTLAALGRKAWRWRARYRAERPSKREKKKKKHSFFQIATHGDRAKGNEGVAAVCFRHSGESSAMQVKGNKKSAFYSLSCFQRDGKRRGSHGGGAGKYGLSSYNDPGRREKRQYLLGGSELPLFPILPRTTQFRREKGAA